MWGFFYPFRVTTDTDTDSDTDTDIQSTDLLRNDITITFYPIFGLFTLPKRGLWFPILISNVAKNLPKKLKFWKKVEFFEKKKVFFFPKNHNRYNYIGTHCRYIGRYRYYNRYIGRYFGRYEYRSVTIFKLYKSD